MGHNDDMDRVFLRHYDSAKHGAVTVFRDSNCRSNSGRFDATYDPKGTRAYTKYDMSVRNTYNDDMTSVMVPYGYSVKLYWDDSWAGESLVINGPSWTDEHMEMQCINVGSHWNDETTSLKVYRTEFGNYAQGDWIGLTATEGIDFTYNEGFTTTRS